MKTSMTIFLIGIFYLSLFSQIDLQIVTVTHFDEVIQDVEFEFNGNSNNDPLMPGDIIIPHKNDNIINGITTFDLVKMSQHILNTSVFLEEWQKVAADINQDGNITILDILEVQFFLLGNNSNIGSWAFIPSQLEVTADTEFPFKFFGVKLGDVNGSLFIDDNNVETRTLHDPLNFFTENISLEKGKAYSIPIFSKNYKSVAGGQFTLEFDPQNIEFESMKSNNLGGLKQNNFGLVEVASGVILSSWINMESKDISEDEAFFNLNFIAKKDGSLSDFFSINSKKLNAEAYFQNGSQFDFAEIQLHFEQNIISKNLSVFPNPFSQQTNFTINLKESGQVILDLFDISGKIIFSKIQSMHKGQNNINLQGSDLSNSGIYFYKIKTKDEIFSGKLILK